MITPDGVQFVALSMPLYFSYALFPANGNFAANFIVQVFLLGPSKYVCQLSIFTGKCESDHTFTPFTNHGLLLHKTQCRQA